MSKTKTPGANPAPATTAISRQSANPSSAAQARPGAKCTRCKRTYRHCLRLGDHYPYNPCCKVCDHSIEESE